MSHLKRIPLNLRSNSIVGCVETLFQITHNGIGQVAGALYDRL